MIHVFYMSLQYLLIPMSYMVSALVIMLVSLEEAIRNAQVCDFLAILFVNLSIFLLKSKSIIVNRMSKCPCHAPDDPPHTELKWQQQQHHYHVLLRLSHLLIILRQCSHNLYHTKQLSYFISVAVNVI